MHITTSRQAYRVFPECVSAEVEEVWILALDSRLQIIQKKMLFRGSVTHCMIHPRDILRFLCLNNAASFIIAHNHPSQDARPSSGDRTITRRIQKLAALIEIPMNDHLILTRNSFYSFTDKNLVKITD